MAQHGAGRVGHGASLHVLGAVARPDDTHDDVDGREKVTLHPTGRDRERVEGVLENLGLGAPRGDGRVLHRARVARATGASDTPPLMISARRHGTRP